MEEGIERRKRINQPGERQGEDDHSSRRSRSAKRRLRLTPEEKAELDKKKKSKRKDERKTPGKAMNREDAVARPGDEEEDADESDASHLSDLDETSIVSSDTDEDDDAGSGGTLKSSRSWAQAVEDEEAMDTAEGGAKTKRKETARKSAPSAAPRNASASIATSATTAATAATTTVTTAGATAAGSDTTAKRRIVLKVIGAYADPEYDGRIYAEKQVAMRGLMSVYLYILET